MTQTKPYLSYDVLQIGMRFPPFTYRVEPAVIQRYLAATGVHNPLYTDPDAARRAGYRGVIAPSGLAVVFLRMSYLHAYAMPGGGVLAKQQNSFHAPIYPGDILNCEPMVTEKYERKSRPYGSIGASARNQHGQLVAESVITMIWPASPPQP